MKSIDALEMWCWRKMPSIPWTVRFANISILEERGILKRLSTVCLQRVLRYFKHVARQTENSSLVLVVTGKVKSRRSRGKSPMRWMAKFARRPEHWCPQLSIQEGNWSKGHNPKRWRNDSRRIKFLYLGLTTSQEVRVCIEIARI